MGKLPYSLIFRNQIRTIAAMVKDTSSQVAYVAEYDSDEGEEVASTRTHATGPSAREQANVAAKRSTDAQGSASSSPRQNSQDLASDSGYSSRTQDTSASADSGKSATPVPPIPQATAAASAPAQSPSKPALSRTMSKNSRRSRSCRDPECEDCKRGRMIKQSANSSQKSASPAQRPPPPERARSTSSKRSSEGPPRSVAPPPQPQARPPLRSASTSRARPRSMYDAPNELRSAGAGPPIAYWNSQRPPYQAQGYVTGAGNMMVAERPGMPHRATDTLTLSARKKPLSMVGAPVVSYDAGAGQRLSARRPTNPTYPAVGFEQDEDEDETEESEAYDSPEDFWSTARQRENAFQAEQARQRALKQAQDARSMPPPQPRPLPQQLPPPPQPAPASGQKYSMRLYDKAATRITYGDHDDDYDGVRSTARGLDTDFMYGGSSRARRSSLASSGDRSKGTSSSQPIASAQRVTIQDPRTSRRQSYVGSEAFDELWAKHINSMRIDPALQAQTLRHKRGSSDFNKVLDPDILAAFVAQERDDRQTRYEKMQEAAMAYQRKTDRLRVPETASLTSKNIRRHSGVPSERDEERSPARSNASNDGSTRWSGHRQIKAVPSERMSMAEGEVRMRIDLSNDVELEFAGRRLAIAPTGEGSIANLIIGSKREETSYHGTSKGSVSTESRLGQSNSVRAKQPATPREPPTPTRSRREVEREMDDDDEEQEYSTTTTGTDPPRRPPATRMKRAETYAAAPRRAAEEIPSESGYEPSKPTRLHRRTKTQDARYDPGPSSPVSSRNKRPFFTRS